MHSSVFSSEDRQTRLWLVRIIGQSHRRGGADECHVWRKWWEVSKWTQTKHAAIVYFWLKQHQLEGIQVCIRLVFSAKKWSSTRPAFHSVRLVAIYSSWTPVSTVNWNCKYYLRYSNIVVGWINTFCWLTIPPTWQTFTSASTASYYYIQ